MSYLKELKQHVIKVRGHVHDAYGIVLLVCTETTKCECLLIPSTSFIIHYPRHSWMFSHQRQVFCSALVSRFERMERVYVSILSDAVSRVHLAIT